MRNNGIVASLIAGALVLSLAGCSTASAPAMPVGARPLSSAAMPVLAQMPASDSVLAPASSDGRIFVSNGRSSSVDIYEKSAPHQLLGMITKGISGPNALAVDSGGDLFVSNVDNQTVTVYPPGSLTPSRTYTRGFHQRLTNPLTVAVGGDGTMYLVNYMGIGQGTQVLEYPPGQMAPNVAIAINGGADGLAVDPSNNLYVSYNGPTGGRILKFAPGSQTGQDLGIHLGFAGGLALDRNLDLLACDQTAPAVDVFPPGSSTPSLVITGNFVNPYGLAFGKYFQKLYVADSASDNVLIFSYPDGSLVGRISRTFTAFGVAVSPAAR